jgi:ATP-dependent DNA helicase MPH1
MEACYKIVGIQRKDTVLMTGETQPGLRAEEWLEKRVFFMTPQTVINDLKTGICDPKKIVLVVVDEAHKATGSYAYTEVVKFLRRFNTSFRIHALTATPGSTVESVQAVIDHLGIARVELRTEQSLDIRAYTHEKHTETELFEYSDEQVLIMDLFSKALRPVLEKLCSQNAYWSRDPMALTPYGLTQSRQRWAYSDAGRKAAGAIKGMVQSIFSVLSSLAHGIGLLKYHGIGPFYSGVIAFQKTVDSGETKAKCATQIAQSEDFTKMTRLIRGWTNNPDFIGHPKLQYLREVVLNHFLDTGEGRQGPDVPPSATRVMVFVSYRDSTEEICRVLKRNEPMIRPHVFVGQAASKGSEGMDQKRQNAVIQDFKTGKYNTLVATSIGEEGLDIGDVDLIVCYDASSSPIRMLQRIGRTGRKRVGRVVLLLMKGKEENDYAKAQDNYSFIQKTIADTNKYTYHDEQSPRILPKGVQPVVDKRMIEIPIENSQPIDLNEKGRKARGKAKVKRPPKKFHMPDGVRTGFTKASRMDAASDDESDEEHSPKKRKPAAKKTAPAKSMRQIAEPETEPVQLPFLEDVLLNGVQHKELERKYAHAAEEDADLVIQPPNPNRYPETMKIPGATRWIRHSRAFGVVQRTMNALGDIDEEKLKWVESGDVISDLLTDAGPARMRLVSPEADIGSENESPLDARPLSKAKSKAAKVPPQKKPPMQRKAPARSAGSVDANEKPSGRPRIQSATSYGSAAAEGSESSPEPTPANMRIGTQGIDLGTMDTSGEDEDEEPDSELDEFIVRSDQPIEIASSSQRLPDDTQPPRPAPMQATVRKRRVIDESDSDE